MPDRSPPLTHYHTLPMTHYLPTWLRTEFAVALDDRTDKHSKPVYYHVTWDEGGATLNSTGGTLGDKVPDGYGLFFVPNFMGQGKRVPKDKDIDQCVVAFVDVDDPSVSLPPSLPRPHFIVHTSPGKFHAYWELTDPITPEQFTKLQKTLADCVGSDRAVSNPARLMRFPGSIHRKGAPFQTVWEEDVTGISLYNQTTGTHTPVSYETLMGCCTVIQMGKNSKTMGQGDVREGIYDPKNRAPVYPQDVLEMLSDLEQTYAACKDLANFPGDRHRKLLTVLAKGWNRIYGLTEMGAVKEAQYATERLINAAASSHHREYLECLRDTKDLVYGNPPTGVDLTTWLNDYKLVNHLDEPSPPAPTLNPEIRWTTTKIASSSLEELKEYLTVLQMELLGAKGSVREDLLVLVKTVSEQMAGMGQGAQNSVGLQLELEQVEAKPLGRLDPSIFHGFTDRLQDLVDIWYGSDIMQFKDQLYQTTWGEAVAFHAKQIGAAFDMIVRGQTSALYTLRELLDRRTTEKIRANLLSDALSDIKGFSQWLLESRYMALFDTGRFLGEVASFVAVAGKFPGVRVSGVNIFTPDQPHGNKEATKALSKYVNDIQQGDPFLEYVATLKLTQYDSLEGVDAFCQRLCDMLGVRSPQSSKLVMGWVAQAYPKMVLGLEKPADYALIIHGEEGIGKTAIARALSGGFMSSISNFQRYENSTLSYAPLCGSRIVNLTEGQVFIENKGEAFKSFMDLTEVEFIPKYSNTRVVVPATWLTIGSTNKKQFLKDTGTNRRIITICSEAEPESFDWEKHLGQGKDKQLFLDFLGAAKWLYENGITPQAILKEEETRKELKEAVSESIAEDANTQALADFRELYEAELADPDSNIAPLLGKTNSQGEFIPYSIPLLTSGDRGPLRWVVENPLKLTEDHLKRIGMKQISAASHEGSEEFRKSSGGWRCRQYHWMQQTAFCPTKDKHRFEVGLHMLGAKMGYDSARYGGLPQQIKE